MDPTASILLQQKYAQRDELPEVGREILLRDLQLRLEDCSDEAREMEEGSDMDKVRIYI